MTIMPTYGRGNVYVSNEACRQCLHGSLQYLSICFQNGCKVLRSFLSHSERLQGDAHVVADLRVPWMSLQCYSENRHSLVPAHARQEPRITYLVHTSGSTKIEGHALHLFFTIGGKRCVWYWWSLQYV